jgi:SAM-dependent methyltransferase
MHRAIIRLRIALGPMPNPDYLDVTYAEDRLPASAYPVQLADWLHTEVFRGPGVLVDVGCGRGDYLRAFAAKGYDVIGIDSAASAVRLAGKIRVELADVERDGLPLPGRSVDYVYSKSVIEHLQKPAAMLAECHRVLKPGGTAVIMTPSWRHTSRVFYEDFTHVSPFTQNGLQDAMTISGFSSVDVRIFWQLPYLWRHPWLLGPTRMLGMLPLPYRPWYAAPWPEDLNKLIRFSKEAMLLAIGRRPQDEASP